MKEWLHAVIGLALGVVFAEVLVRVVMATTSVPAQVAHRYGPDSERLGWLYARRVRGPDNVFVEDPDIGWISHPGQYRGEGWTANVTAEGVRAPAPPSKERTPGKVRLAAFGDSFGFGWDQSDDHTWQAELLARAPDLEIANLAVCGHDTGQALLRYRRDGRAWQPDVVLLAYNKLLLGRTVEPFTMYQRPIVPAERGVFEPEGGPIPSQEAMEAALWARPQLLMVLGMARHAWWGQGGRWQVAERRSAALLDRFVEEVKADGRTPIVAWFVTPDEVRQVAEGGAPDVRCPKDQGVACVDLTAPLVALHRAGVEVEQGTHWSDPAAKAVADQLAVVLRERGLIQAEQPAPL